MSTEKVIMVTWCNYCSETQKNRDTCDYTKTKPGACTKCVKDKYQKWCTAGPPVILDRSARKNRGSRSIPQSDLPEDEEDLPANSPRSRKSSPSKVTKHQQRSTASRKKSKPSPLDFFTSKEVAQSPLTPSPTTQKYLTENATDPDRFSDHDYDNSSSKLSSAPSTPKQQPNVSPSLPPRSESHASTMSQDPTTSQTTPDDTGPSIGKTIEISWADISRQDFCRWLIIGEWNRGHPQPCYWPNCTKDKPQSANRIFSPDSKEERQIGEPPIGDHILNDHLGFRTFVFSTLRPSNIIQPAFRHFESAFADVESIFASMQIERLVNGEAWVDEKTSIVEESRIRLKDALREILTNAYEKRSRRYP